MGRMIKVVAIVAVVGFVGLVGYAYLGDMAPHQAEVTKPVALNGQ